MNNDEISSGERLFAPKNRAYSILFGIIITVLFAYIAFFMFFTFVPVDGPSMENTIFNGERCFSQRMFFNVERGDIVIINTAEKNEKEHIIIKRVIGTGGDKILFMLSENGKNVDLYICRNGENRYTLLDEPYIKEKMIPDKLNPDHKPFSSPDAKIKINISDYIDGIDRIDVTSGDELLMLISPCVIEVPQNSIFALGDNRNVSRDGRYYGTFTLDQVTLKVLKIISSR